MGRTTNADAERVAIIDKDGVVRWKVVNPASQARDLAEYSKALATLG